MSNKQYIALFFDALERGAIETIQSLIATGVKWEIVGLGARSRDEVCANLEQTFATTDTRSAKLLSLIAEGDEVHALVASSFVYKNGKTLDNTLSLTYRFAANQIIECTEFMDMDRVRAFFAPPAA
ncbi:MAG: nuclear transport factor 2 family protein [Porticoccaceae bacterium]|jgi:ketosteroid isomerase-like protein|nr:nuclear transport factor 2 family protein [Porticoccaceae bacterium]